MSRGCPTSSLAGALAALALAALGGCASSAPASLPEASSIPSAWTAYAGNPLLSGSQLAMSAWNDPCVVGSSDAWVMYLSRNVSTAGGRDQGAVAIFRATSADGLTWSMGSGPVLEPGAASDFDFNAVETPSVLYFKDAWHMYYGGISQNESSPSYRIGHATSSDGASWTKDSSYVLGKESLSGAGNVYHVGEPAAIVVGTEVWLYFAVTSEGSISIWRGKSSDGSSFSNLSQVLAKGSAFADSSYLGYSTPCALLDGTKVQLFYDVYQRRPETNGTNEYQVALMHAVSADGLSFSEDSGPFIARSDAAWTAREVRAPWVVSDGATWKLWYAGDDYVISGGGWTGSMGIGYATAPASAFD
jgi:predicted GH43/DUF377 family glycosyl hydrolase